MGFRSIRAETHCISPRPEKSPNLQFSAQPGVSHRLPIPHIIFGICLIPHTKRLFRWQVHLMDHLTHISKLRDCRQPAILPIYHGTDADTLEIGIGHLLGTSLPVGGESTHTVLTAHSGMANQKMFSDLDLVKEGDVFYLEILDEILAYQVDAINIVLPHDTTHLGITTGEDYCTLVTCTPFGVNTHRLLVRGTRIPYEEAEQITAEITVEEAAGSTWEEKYVNGILTGFTIVCLIAILGGVIWFSRRR